MGRRLHYIKYNKIRHKNNGVSRFKSTRQAKQPQIQTAARVNLTWWSLFRSVIVAIPQKMKADAVRAWDMRLHKSNMKWGSKRKANSPSTVTLSGLGQEQEVRDDRKVKPVLSAWTSRV